MAGGGGQPLIVRKILGVGKGDRVALLCGNTIEFVVAYFACLGRGIVCVPLNPTAPAPELQRELSVVGARAVVIAPSAVAGWSGVDRSALGHLAHVIATTQDLDGALQFRDLLQHEPAPVVDMQPNDLAIMLFTSGTAGSPKAAACRSPRCHRHRRRASPRGAQAPLESVPEHRAGRGCASQGA